MGSCICRSFLSVPCEMICYERILSAKERHALFIYDLSCTKYYDYQVRRQCIDSALYIESLNLVHWKNWQKKSSRFICCQSSLPSLCRKKNVTGTRWPLRGPKWPLWGANWSFMGPEWQPRNSKCPLRGLMWPHTGSKSCRTQGESVSPSSKEALSLPNAFQRQAHISQMLAQSSQRLVQVF